MNTYEAMLLLDNREVKKGWDGLKEIVDGVFKKHGAEIIVAKRWDERKLAYEIKKQRRATYYLAYIKAAPDSLAQMNFDLKLSEPILRHLILKVDEIPAEAYEPEKEFQVEASSEAKGTPPTKDGAETEGQAEEVVAAVAETEIAEETIVEVVEAGSEAKKEAKNEAEGADSSSDDTPAAEDKE